MQEPLSTRPRKTEYHGRTLSRPRTGHGQGNRDRNKPQQNKSTYAHESHLNELIGKPVTLMFPAAGEGNYARLIGYDAFTVTVEGFVTGRKLTFFKNQLIGFMLSVEA